MNSSVKKTKNRRALRKNKNKKCIKNLKLIGFNSAGLASKLTSFDHILSTLQPSVFFIQETKMRKQGKIRTKLTENYQIFELIRTEKQGGGLAIGAVKDLEPIWIAEGDDEVEIIVIEIKVEDLKIRCICGYGPQENESLEKKLNFWARLSGEVQEAIKNEKAIIIQMDGNSWVGNEVIKNDPNKCNNNGKLFKEFLNDHPYLTVVNSLEICEGKITRKRITKYNTEEAILDFFLVCEKIAAFVEKLEIDEEKQYPLTRYTQKTIKHSDHNTMILHLSINYWLKKPERIELFNFKNVEDQKVFYEKTENSTILSDCFRNKRPMERKCNDWFTALKTHFYDCFNKIRCKANFNSKNPIVKLMKERSYLIHKNKTADENIKDKIDTNLKKIEEQIANLTAEENRKKVFEDFGKLSNTDGTTNINGIWSLKRKLFPKNSEPIPIAKRNPDGRLISSKNELLNLYLDTYKHRLRHRPIKSKFVYLKQLKQKLFTQRLEIAKTRKSEPWNLEQLKSVLRELKTGKARDPHGLINEIFKIDVAGIDFQTSFLEMANEIKKNIFFPKFMQYANIVSIYKGKGRKEDLNNDRGIFLVNIFRSIVMKMVYKDKYDIVDSNMSDSNVGARKHKNIRNHLFVINGIINDVIVNKKESVDIQILDYKQCFDSLWLEESINDLWEAGLRDDKLALIAKANETVKVAVRTPFGKTNRVDMNNFVMQGEIFGPLCCSVTIDTFGKECEKNEKHLYYYKGKVGIPPLAMIDDLLCVSKCGIKSVLMNAFINAKTNIKKLQFGETKCHKMHVGLTCTDCPDLYVDRWKLENKKNIFTSVEDLEDIESGETKLETVEYERYLGDILSSNGKNKKNILSRRSKGVGIVNQILTILEGTCYGTHVFEVGLLFRKSILINSILTNSESWYGLKNEEIEQLEQVDEMFLRKLLEVGRGCPKEMLYLETGSLPIRFIIMSRRLMFLHYLLNEENDSLVHKVLQEQMRSPAKNDWILVVQENMEELDIGLDLETIKTLSKDSFKAFIEKKINTKALEYLNKLKSKHSKVMHVVHKNLKVQEYFEAAHVEDTCMAKLIFHARTRMLNVKANYKSQYLKTDMNCPMGCPVLDSQEHVILCTKIESFCLNSEKNEPKYKDLFTEDSSKQKTIAKIIKGRLEKRKTYI